MTDLDPAERRLKLIQEKLDILRNFQIVADNGLRQQQSAAHDEILSVLRDINAEIRDWMREYRK